MKAAINQYFSILRLADEPFVDLKQNDRGLRWTLILFLIIGLIASSGKWLNLNYELQRATYAEQIESLTEQSADLGMQIEQIGSDLTGVMAWLFADSLAQVATFFSRDLVEFGTNLVPMVIDLEPPIGVRSSRVLALAGDWFSTPFALLANSLLFIFTTLVVAKAWEGNGTLREHLSLMLLMIAPAFLLFFSYVTPQSSVLVFAVRPLSRLLTLVYMVWAVLIGLKALTVVHDFSWRTAIRVMATAVLVLYVIVPIVTVLVLAYLIA